MRSIQRGTRTILLLLLALCLPATARAQGTIIPFITQQFLDASGNPVNGGKVCTYVSGLSTPQATYSDVTLQTLNSNPVILSSNGRPTSGAIFLLPTSYKFVLRTAGADTTCNTGTILWTLDNISAIPTTAANLDITGTAGEALAAGDLVYLSDGSGGATVGRWYKADADQTYSSNLASTIGFATAAIASGDSGTLRLAGRQTGLSGLTAGSDYYASATAGGLTATAPTNTRFVGRADSTTAIVVGEPTHASIIARAMRVNAGTPYTLTWPAADAAGFIRSDGAGVLSITGVTVPMVAEGRITATSGTAVTTADVSAATSVYYTPYGGNRVALYDGAAWNTRTFTEITISLSGCTASRPYDVFLYDNATVVTAETLVWTSATARATALTTQDGVLVKSGQTTSRYMGSFYCNSSGGQTDDTFLKRSIYNYYNRAPRPMRRLETTSSWTYTSATIRQANASTANQVEVMVGVADVQFTGEIFTASANSNANVERTIGFGLDSTNSFITGQVQSGTYASGVPASNVYPMTASVQTFPAVGRHVYSWNEKSTATGTTTWYGNPVGNDFFGIMGTITY